MKSFRMRSKKNKTKNRRGGAAISLNNGKEELVKTLKNRIETLKIRNTQIDVIETKLRELPIENLTQLSKVNSLSEKFITEITKLI